MRVFLKEVSGSTTKGNSDYMDYWILGKLDNGTEIEIFDLKPFNVKKYENQELDCLLLAWIQEISAENNSQYDYFGKFIEKYETPSKWRTRESLLGSEKYGEAIETTEGIFLTDSGEFLNDIKDGQTIYFNVIRFDLIYWLEI